MVQYVAIDLYILDKSQENNSKRKKKELCVLFNVKRTYERALPVHIRIWALSSGDAIHL